MSEKEGFTMLDKSGFNRRLHALSDKVEALFYYLASLFKELNLEKIYIIDSFPVASVTIFESIALAWSEKNFIGARLLANVDSFIVFGCN